MTSSLSMKRLKTIDAYRYKEGNKKLPTDWGENKQKRLWSIGSSIHWTEPNRPITAIRLITPYRINPLPEASRPSARPDRPCTYRRIHEELSSSSLLSFSVSLCAAISVHCPWGCWTCRVGRSHSFWAISRCMPHGNGGCRGECGAPLHPRTRSGIYSTPREKEEASEKWNWNRTEETVQN